MQKVKKIEPTYTSPCLQDAMVRAAEGAKAASRAEPSHREVCCSSK